MKRQHSKKPRLLILAFLAPLVLLAGCAEQEDKPPLVRPVRTMKVGEADLFGGRVFPGRAEAVQAVDIAFEVQGRLIERPVNIGDRVKKDQVLAKLDPRDYQNDLDAVKAQLERATAYLARINSVAETGAVSQQDVTDAYAQFHVAKANVKLKQKALADARIVAPFDGVIAATYVENFQNVQRKEPVVRLLDLSRIELKIDVPEKLITFVPEVKNLTVSFETFPGQPVPAEIKEIGTEASATTRTYPVTLVMEQPDGFTLLPGMTGQARGWPEDKASSAEGPLQVVGSAVFEEDGKHYVWTVDESSLTVHRQEVHPLGVNALGLQVEGLDRGQRIVTTGVHYLQEGRKVRLLDDSEERESKS